jgi:meiosis-specific APC/C activator protein AMA1
VVPATPFRVLDAPGLRDDYYCSLLAYSPTTHSLAVGLHSDIYSWHESTGARPFEQYSSSHVTSLAFSSAEGSNNILAIGRIDGSLTLWNPAEAHPRLEQPHQVGIACLAWKPSPTPRISEAVEGLPNTSGFTEDLLAGDESGHVYLYEVVWGSFTRPQDASIILIRRIIVHNQQICGLAWSVDGKQFATGGNDNVAFLFDTAEIDRRYSGSPNPTPITQTVQGCERYRWYHGAAVKAIAFCPWQKTLLATGIFKSIIHRKLD